MLHNRYNIYWKTKVISILLKKFLIFCTGKYLEISFKLDNKLAEEHILNLILHSDKKLISFSLLSEIEAKVCVGKQVVKGNPIIDSYFLLFFLYLFFGRRFFSHRIWESGFDTFKSIYTVSNALKRLSKIERIRNFGSSLSDWIIYNGIVYTHNVWTSSVFHLIASARMCIISNSINCIRVVEFILCNQFAVNSERYFGQMSIVASNMGDEMRCWNIERRNVFFSLSYEVFV